MSSWYILWHLLSLPFCRFHILIFRLLLGSGQKFERLPIIRVEAVNAIMHLKYIVVNLTMAFGRDYMAKDQSIRIPPEGGICNANVLSHIITLYVPLKTAKTCYVYYFPKGLLYFGP